MGTSTASFDIDARTDRGRQRSNNQDSIGRADRWKNRDGQPIERSLRERYGRLYIVADGVGGNADGADASRMVVDEVMQAFYYDTRLPEEPVERLRAAIEFVTSVIHAEAHRRRNNMASTIVAALIHDNTLTIANVGDSPALLCRPGQTPKLLTKAHVRREADGGTSLAQAMGDQQVVPSIFSMPLEEGDAVVLCSDGLTDLVRPDEIAEIVSTRPAGDATRTLIALANRRGGHDNISAIVVRNAPPPKRAAPLRRSASAHGSGSPGSGRAAGSGAAGASFAERCARSCLKDHRNSPARRSQPRFSAVAVTRPSPADFRRQPSARCRRRPTRRCRQRQPGDPLPLARPHNRHRSAALWFCQPVRRSFRPARRPLTTGQSCQT
jgi:serine/threonine protein phosphatase PrpC